MPVQQARGGRSPAAGFDRLDRRIAAALQVDSRGSWRDLARLAGTSEATVARRVRALRDAGLAHTTMVADTARCGLGYPVLVQIACRPGTVGAVARDLAAREEVRGLAIVTGPFDLAAEVLVTSSEHLAEVLVDEIALVDGIVSVATVSVLRLLKSSKEWGRQQFFDPDDPGGGQDGGLPPAGHVDLDEVDLALVRALRADARRSYAELAAVLGMSPSAARRRVEKLVDAGCLMPVTLVSPRLLGLGVETLMFMRVDLSRLEEVAAALRDRREVRSLAAASGGDSDLVLEVTLATQDDLYRFRTHVLGRIAGIQTVQSALVLRTVKRAYVRLDDLPAGAQLNA